MKFLLETLSPINIGNASVLSPYSDYYYDNGFVYYINQDRLSQEIAKLPNADEVTDKYVAFIKQQSKSNNPEKYNIKDFLMDAGIDLLHVANVKLEANTKITEEINRTINTSGRPYIPGSTLKGAIRTGIMVSEYLDSKNFDYYQAKRINGYIGQELFGNYDKDIFKHLAVSDTSLFSEKDKKVIKTYRYNLKTNQKTIPVVKEVIKTGSFAEFSIKTMGNEKIHNINQKHSYLLSGNECKILPKFNTFSKKCIEREISELSKYHNQEILEIINYYKSLSAELNGINENESAIIRIGSGKTIFENTIATIFNNDDLKKWIIERKSGKGNNFPISRTVSLNGPVMEVCGWIKITALLH